MTINSYLQVNFQSESIIPKVIIKIIMELAYKVVVGEAVLLPSKPTPKIETHILLKP